MHGGFGGGGGGGGHGGGGHSGGGHHSGGHDGGGHASHHGGQDHSQPIAAHNLGGQSQSIIGHMTSLVANGQGILGHIAGWLVGQHQGIMHHTSGTQNHLGDQSWTSAALQVDKAETWVTKITKIPGIHFFFVFLVVAGWLVFLGVLRHGDAEHVVRSPMPTQQEWRQELVGSNSESAEQQTGGEVSQPDMAQSTANFGAPATSMFGNPRSGADESPQAAYAQAPMQMPIQQMQQQQQAPAQVTSAFGSAPAPAAAGGRRSFSARSAMSGPGSEPPVDGRGFHHRVIAER
jgi:hypothetical protein